MCAVAVRICASNPANAVSTAIPTLTLRLALHLHSRLDDRERLLRHGVSDALEHALLEFATLRGAHPCLPVVCRAGRAHFADQLTVSQAQPLSSALPCSYAPFSCGRAFATACRRPATSTASLPTSHAPVCSRTSHHTHCTHKLTFALFACADYDFRCKPTPSTSKTTARTHHCHCHAQTTFKRGSVPAAACGRLWPTRCAPRPARSPLHRAADAVHCTAQQHVRDRPEGTIGLGQVRARGD